MRGLSNVAVLAGDAHGIPCTLLFTAHTLHLTLQSLFPSPHSAIATVVLAVALTAAEADSEHMQAGGMWWGLVTVVSGILEDAIPSHTISEAAHPAPRLHYLHATVPMCSTVFNMQE